MPNLAFETSETIERNMVNDYACLRPGEYLSDAVANGYLAIIANRYPNVLTLDSSYTLRSRKAKWPKGTKVIPKGTVINVTETVVNQFSAARKQK